MPPERGVLDATAHRTARRLVGNQLPDAGAARQPGLRPARNSSRSSTAKRSRPVRHAELRSGRGRRGAVHRARRTPEIAILREQGVNSQLEMAAAFDRAGFRRHRRAHDRPDRRPDATSSDFRGLVACGGFSYGDVLGAGEGWAKSILFNEELREQFAALLCAARQLRARRLQRLPDDVHAAAADPRRRALAAIRAQPFGAVRGPRRAGRSAADAVDLLPRHGRLAAADRGGARRGQGGVQRAKRPNGDCANGGLVACAGSTTTARSRRRYPSNPNGSPAGITGLTTVDGRVTILMPHPERVYRTVQNSWHPDELGRGRRLDADVPQCQGLGRLGRD